MFQEFHTDRNIKTGGILRGQGLRIDLPVADVETGHLPVGFRRGQCGRPQIDPGDLRPGRGQCFRENPAAAAHIHHVTAGQIHPLTDKPQPQRD